jgi:hypothetical protein
MDTTVFVSGMKSVETAVWALVKCSCVMMQRASHGIHFGADVRPLDNMVVEEAQLLKNNKSTTTMLRIGRIDKFTGPGLQV